MVDPEPGPLAARRRSRRRRRGVAGVLLVDVRRRRRARPASRACCGPGHLQAEVLADREQLRRPRPGRRPRTRSGSRRGWSASTASAPRGCPVWSPSQTSGCSTETGVGLPRALEVALVGDQQRAALAAPGDHLAQVVDRAAPGRSGSTGELTHTSDTRSGPSAVSASVATQSGAGEPGAHLVRRVGQRRGDDQVARRPSPSWVGQRGDQLLGADHRQHRVERRARSRRTGGPASRRRPARVSARPTVSG